MGTTVITACAPGCPQADRKDSGRAGCGERDAGPL